MFNDITIEEAFKKGNAVFIDVRSPAEYTIDAIPSAVNVPVLDNEQRAQVGRVYQEEGAKEARLLAAKLVSPTLPEKIEKIRKIADNKEIIFYCWRGGMRSRAMCELLDLAGIHSWRLVGGYKAYRRFICNYFNQRHNYNFIVLYGLTGVGKTEILQNLRRKGLPTLDLEELARHRGSVFGGVGLAEQPSQKKFETGLYQVLTQYQESQFIFVEGESRKIGKLIIPEQVFYAMQKGKKVLVYDQLENRIKRILQEYTKGLNYNLEELENGINDLQRHIGKAKVKMLLEFFQQKKFAEICKELLINYYDKLYRHSVKLDEPYDFYVCAENIENAVDELINYAQRLS